MRKPPQGEDEYVLEKAICFRQEKKKNQELIIYELIEMPEQIIEELDSLKPVQSKDRMTVGNLKDDLSLIEGRLQILEKIDSIDQSFSPTESEK
ncbi:hypothetical protein TNCV_2985711 [Trichonephila clavipes]|nr:hypothetical protein TNCV_2985711 [Trichonephila clavipes]